jgi:predicted Ser/Thr protein kinase
MAVLRQAYAEAKARGEFTIKPGVPSPHLRCKNDTYKLCLWHLRRKKGFKDLQVGLKEAMEARAKRLVRDHIQRQRQQEPWTGRDGQQAKTYLLAKLGYPAKTDFEQATGLRKEGVRVDRLLGKGAYGIVFKGLMGRTACAVKFVLMDKQSKREDFEYEVYMQERMQRALPLHVPKVLASWLVCRHSQTIGVIVMERIEAGIRDLLPANHRPSFMLHIARQLLNIVVKLKEAGLSHGDLHLGNIGYNLVGNMPRLMLMDFGRSSAIPSDNDAFWVWWSSTSSDWTCGDIAALNLTRALCTVRLPGCPGGVPPKPDNDDACQELNARLESACGNVVADVIAATVRHDTRAPSQPIRRIAAL